MTVREAFEKAGYPVPRGWRVSQIMGTIGLLADGTDFHKGQCLSNWYQFQTIKTMNGEEQLLVEHGVRDRTRVIDLSNLPAIDAYDALPDVVRKVLKP